MPNAATHRPAWMPAVVAAAICCGTAVLGTVAAPAATTTTRSDPADAVLDRLLDQPRPATDPATSPASDRTLSPGGFAGATDASSGNGADAIAPDTAPQKLVREGTYVVDRVGFARRGTDGQGVEFVFASDGTTATSAGDPPMVLVPNLNLMALESAAASEPDRRFRVTGRVTEYRGRNHLLLDKVVVLR